MLFISCMNLWFYRGLEELVKILRLPKEFDPYIFLLPFKNQLCTVSTKKYLAKRFLYVVCKAVEGLGTL